MHRRDVLRACAGVVTTAAVAGRTTANRSFAPTGSLSLAGTKETVVSPDGQTGYVAVTDGYATVDLSDPESPRLLAERRGLQADRENGPMAVVYDVAVDGETLAVVGPANPTRGESLQGVLLVDVSSPSEPASLGFYESSFPIHNCAFENGHVYLTGNGRSQGTAPLVVIDATDPTAPEELARWRLTDHDDRWSEVSLGMRPLHDVWVHDGLAAAAYWDAGTYLLDVSDPATPTHLGTAPALGPREAAAAADQQSTTPPGNHHYTATNQAGDVLAVGKESWGLAAGDDYVGGPSGIELYDISDPTAPRQLSEIQPPATPDPTFRGYWTTAHNFELAGDTLYSSWYHGGVKRHDVSDPANPVELSWWVEPDTTRFWTAQAVNAGETMLAATMGTGDSPAGIRVFPETDGVGGTPETLAPTTPSPGPTTTDRATTDAADETTEPTGEETTAAAPGFGVAAGLAGVGALAWRLRHRET